MKGVEFGRGERRCLWLGIGALLSFIGCPKAADKSPRPDGKEAATSTAAKLVDQRGIPSAREDTRFVKIRNLLSLDPEAPERATKLYALVVPICSDLKERTDFVDVAKWSSSFSVDMQTLPTVLALDTIEHVATSCFRTSPDAAFDLIEKARAAIPDPYRYELMIARLKAASGDLDAALKASKTAAAAGSIHALALTANIEAQAARDKGAGYRDGMLEEAIKTVSVEPDAHWQLIDLTAVLSTRAHLLTERAVWEQGDRALETRKQAQAAYKRLAVAPFIGPTRSPALDQLCFDTVDVGDDGFGACRRAAEELGNLGAKTLAKVEPNAKTMDLERLQRLEKLRDELASLQSGSVALVVFRGDESELLTWALPASKVIARAAKQGAKIVVVDRTKSPRANVLVERIVELAGVKPTERIRASDTLAMPCIAAVIAGRRAPQSCPVEAKQRARLGRLGKFGIALLVGRDLDAEIDDLHLYELNSELLSFRMPRIEKGLEVQLKSLSDVWIVAPPP
jgi:hypothetical protein